MFISRAARPRQALRPAQRRQCLAPYHTSFTPWKPFVFYVLTIDKHAGSMAASITHECLQKCIRKPTETPKKAVWYNSYSRRILHLLSSRVYTTCPQIPFPADGMAYEQSYAQSVCCARMENSVALAPTQNQTKYCLFRAFTPCAPPSFSCRLCGLQGEPHPRNYTFNERSSRSEPSAVALAVFIVIATGPPCFCPTWGKGMKNGK